MTNAEADDILRRLRQRRIQSTAAFGSPSNSPARWHGWMVRLPMQDGTTTVLNDYDHARDLIDQGCPGAQGETP